MPSAGSDMKIGSEEYLYTLFDRVDTVQIKSYDFFDCNMKKERVLKWHFRWRHLMRLQKD